MRAEILTCLLNYLLPCIHNFSQQPITIHFVFQAAAKAEKEKLKALEKTKEGKASGGDAKEKKEKKEKK